MRSSQQFERRRNVLRSVLFVIIVGTIPFYCLGFWLWGTSPASRAPQETSIPTASWTPIGRDSQGTSILAPSITPFATGTFVSPLQPTPIQFNPVNPAPVATSFIPPTAFVPSATAVIIPTSTFAPTLTPIPTNTPIPLPTNTLVPTATPLPPPTDTPLPPPSDTPETTASP